MVPFALAGLRCACGSADVMCVDPGGEAELDPVLAIVLRRGVPARGFCRECWALLPARAGERPARRRGAP